MPYPVKLAAVLTGASSSQLNRWRRDGLLAPEISADRPILYSYRDLVAVRTFVKLRATGSLSIQRIRKSQESLREMDFNDHPAAYRFVTDGHIIALLDQDDEPAIDLTRHPGAAVMRFSLAEVFNEFKSRSGRTVVPFQRPAPGVQVKPSRMGGWPTIEGTRIAFDTISSFIGDDERNFNYVSQFYPGVTQEAARGAVQLASQVGAA